MNTDDSQFVRDQQNSIIVPLVASTPGGGLLPGGRATRLSALFSSTPVDRFGTDAAPSSTTPTRLFWPLPDPGISPRAPVPPLPNENALQPNSTLSALCLAAMMATVPAATPLTIDDVIVPAGITATVSVSIASDGVDLLSGFHLPVDFNSDGFFDADSDGFSELPLEFTLASPSLDNAIFGNTGLDQPQSGLLGLIGADAIATGSGVDTAVTGTPIQLFDLVIEVSPNAAPGTTLPIQIFVPDDPFSQSFNIARPDD